MSNLYGIIGTSTPEHLLSDLLNGHPIAVPMEPGNGTVKRGTVIYRKDSGLWAAAAAANVVNTNLLAVINEEIDTGTGSVAENAAAYQTGRFIDGKVTLAEDAELTAANKATLATVGIFFDQSAESAEDFNNGNGE